MSPAHGGAHGGAHVRRRYDRCAHVEAAALGRLDDSLAARRSLGVAGFGSGRAKPAMLRGEQEEAR